MYIKIFYIFLYMTNRYVVLTCYTGWCGLGFIRGMNSYDYRKKNIYKYEKKYIYTDSISNGLLGTILYANPPLFPYFIYKELYRLEINIRNLEDEKKSTYYNYLL